MYESSGNIGPDMIKLIWFLPSKPPTVEKVAQASLQTRKKAAKQNYFIEGGVNVGPTCLFVCMAEVDKKGFNLCGNKFFFFGGVIVRPFILGSLFRVGHLKFGNGYSKSQTYYGRWSSDQLKNIPNINMCLRVGINISLLLSGKVLHWITTKTDYDEHSVAELEPHLYYDFHRATIIRHHR